MKPYIGVVNRSRFDGTGVIYVGRPSALGNPFVIGRDGTREEVIAKYKEWLIAQPPESPAKRNLQHLRDLVKDRGALILSCWCAPLPCHADVIAEMLREDAETKVLA